MTISVCTLALNEEKKISKCLESVKNLADEIIVGIDSLSSDRSKAIAEMFTSKVLIIEHNDNFHIGKNKIIDKANSDWIFWVDGDEYLSTDLIKEIKSIIVTTEKNGFYVPRKNIIWGKEMNYTAWYPDYQLRLFRRGMGKYPCQKIHENQEVEGKIGYLRNDLYHYNYESVSQFIEKLNKYTSLDIRHVEKEIKQIRASDFLSRPIDEFIKRFLAEKGYKDGIHGLVLSLMQSFYQLVVIAKIWEKRGFKQNKIKLEEVKKQGKSLSRKWRWWINENRINESDNKAEKVFYKIKRKLGL